MAKDRGLIELVISSDNMQLLGRIDPSGDMDLVSEVRLLEMLSAHSIEPTEDLTRRVSCLVTRLKKGDFPTEDVVLAEGVPPEPGEDGYIVWAEGCDPDHVHVPDDDSEIDHYARSDIVSVSAGEPVCTIVHPTRGRPGRDIYGREAPSRKGRRHSMVLGESITHDPDNPTRMIALKSGRLNIAGRHIWISPLLIINRNVDFICGSIDFDGDVMIRGNVLDLFSVKATGNIVVRGLIEGARVEAGGNLVAVGGIAGKEKAVIKVEGKLKARFADNATVTGGTEIFILREILNSKVSTPGRLVTPGTVAGCTIEACRGIQAAVVGAPSGVRTTLGVGFDRETQKKLARMELEMTELQGVIGQGRKNLEPLLRRNSKLSKLLKNRMVRFLTSIREQMARVEELEQEKLRLQELIRTNRNATIKVSQIICEGTTVRIGKASLTLRDSLRGPLILLAHKVDGQDRVAATSRNRAIVVLDACAV